ncbi:transglutaminase domain-containing protein [Paenibacillus kobensis]|uniref:transglutaminase domain-containing protein n=1 Tax=Paenibacillus kobensis TaxID=59841 RepID=UPI000FDC90CB|nr:transglutaminase domain-containing protein [Paenibacillus kobensis]
MRNVRIILVLTALGLLGAWPLLRGVLHPGERMGESPAAAAAQKGLSLPEVIEEHLLAREQKFSFTMYDYEDAEQTFKQAFAEAAATNDYTAYIIDSYHYTIRERTERADVEMTVNYRESADQTAQVDQITTQALQSIITAGMNDHEKVKAIHDWVVDRVEYDTSLTRYTAYEALLTGKTVCQGYALLMHNMLTKAGFVSRIVEGTVSSGDHAWNLVRLDGQWYHLDATWDDAAPPAQAENGGEAKESAEQTASRYRYYLLSDKQIERDHQWTKRYPKAVTAYSETLALAKEAGSKTQAAEWAKLEAAIGLDWLSPSRTVQSVGMLAERLMNMARNNKSELQIRYTNGENWSDDIRAAIRKASIPDGYTVRSYPYGTDGSVLLHIRLMPGT